LPQVLNFNISTSYSVTHSNNFCIITQANHHDAEKQMVRIITLREVVICHRLKFRHAGGDATILCRSMLGTPKKKSSISPSCPTQIGRQAESATPAQPQKPGSTQGQTFCQSEVMDSTASASVHTTK
jgi:hypothetical protein